MLKRLPELHPKTARVRVRLGQFSDMSESSLESAVPNSAQGKEKIRAYARFELSPASLLPYVLKHGARDQAIRSFVPILKSFIATGG